MKKTKGPLTQVIGAAFLEAIEENGELTEVLKEILETPELTQTLTEIVQSYLDSNEGRAQIISAIDNNDLVGEALLESGIESIIFDMVMEKLRK